MSKEEADVLRKIFNEILEKAQKEDTRNLEIYDLIDHIIRTHRRYINTWDV